MERRYQRDTSKKVTICNAVAAAALIDPVAPPAGMVAITSWDAGAGAYPEAFVLGLRANTGDNSLTAGLVLGWDPKGGVDGAGALVIVGEINAGAAVALKTTRGREFVFERIAGITHLAIVGTLNVQKLDAWASPLYRAGC